MATFKVRREYKINLDEHCVEEISRKFGDDVLRDLLIACTYFADIGDCKELYLKRYLVGNEVMNIKVGDFTWEDEDAFDDVEETVYVLKDWAFTELGNEVVE